MNILLIGQIIAYILVALFIWCMIGIFVLSGVDKNNILLDWFNRAPGCICYFGALAIWPYLLWRWKK